jgi:hypothetical protein
MDYAKQLYAWIAWDGNGLGPKQYLSEDISFRRLLTNTFSLARPYPARLIEQFVQENEFDDLLRQAIREAARDLEDWVPKNIHLAPETVPILISDKPDADLRAIWTARLLVFDRLVKNQDFVQCMAEFEFKRESKWYRKLYKWGETLSIPNPSEATPGKPELGVGGVFRELYKPIMFSLMFAFPALLGAKLVSDHVIEKQEISREHEREVFRELQKEFHVIDHLDGEACCRTQATVCSSEDPDGIQTGLSVLQANIVALQNQINNLNIRVTNNPSHPEKDFHVTLSADKKLGDTLQSFNTAVGQVKVIPDSGIKLWLGNASTSSEKPTPLNIAQTDVNVHQLPYPFQNNPPATPYILEFGPGQKVWSLTPDYTLELASSRAPYHFLLKPKDPKKEARTLSITKSPQYVEELESFLSIDTTSRRKFLVAGPHSVVLQVAPTKQGKLHPEIAAGRKSPTKPRTLR